MKKVISIAIVLGSSWFALLTLAQPVCGQSAGVTTREAYASALLGQTMFYTVYTPPCYDPAAKAYPVIYLMHGSNDDDRQWVRLDLPRTLDEMIAMGDAPPTVVVMPFGNVIANRNRFDARSWANIFRDELLPDAEAKYNIATTRDQRAIGGISRGGFWAYQVAFSSPELFSIVGGHSAFFDRFHAEPQDNPLDLATVAPQLETMRLWLDHGADDFAAPGLALMAERLAERRLNYVYIVKPQGQHANSYWSQHVREYLEFYVADWLAQPQQNPTRALGFGGFATNTPNAPRPTSTPMPEMSSEGALFLPVVAFPSLQTTLDSERLNNIASGTFDANLILSAAIAQQIRGAGFVIHPDTRIVAADDLRAELWADRDAFSLLPLDALSLDFRVLWVDDTPITTQADDYAFLRGNMPQFTRLTLSGVTAITRNVRTAINENSVEWAASGIFDYVTESDFFHISNEVSLFATCPQTSGALLGGSSSFCTQPDHMQILTALDVDVVELSGNHNNDYGYEAYRDTLAFYRENGIATVGGGENMAEARAPLILEQGDNRIGWIVCNAVGPYYALVNEDPQLLGGVRPGAASCEWEWLEMAIPQLAQVVDVIIVTVQHQEVEDYTPPQQQQFDFRRLANLGADVVIGTAAHKPQTYEFFNTDGADVALLHYGMGNLFFDQPFWGNRRFFINTLIIADGQLRGLEIFPGIIDDLARPRLMTAEERENFLFFMFREQNGF